ncbi:hypothetical protein J1792_17235 [Streptomyces triculaminicus]|uniref:Uncharacterized protein n=1 Tax=Streptomyces triculaminicus TaxID=2816232 RepID=A0A939JMQ5_9ACTN|nr:hypothetical protein [Streptomyces triculaminicus]
MDRPLLSLRTTLVFLLALLVGTAGGVLTALAGEGTPRSVLAGLAAAGLAVSFFDRLIAAEPGPEPGGDRRRGAVDAGAGVGEGQGHG